MYYLQTEDSFDSAHFLSGYDGKCKNIHGHRWKVVVDIQSENLQSNPQFRGMCVDFSDLKKDLSGILDVYDHALIIETGSLKEKTLEALKEESFRVIELPFRPTAENFAKFFFEQMQKKGYDPAVVHVYETPKNCASYRA